MSPANRLRLSRAQAVVELLGAYRDTGYAEEIVKATIGQYADGVAEVGGSWYWILTTRSTSTRGNHEIEVNREHDYTTANALFLMKAIDESQAEA